MTQPTRRVRPLVCLPESFARKVGHETSTDESSRAKRAQTSSQESGSRAGCAWSDPLGQPGAVQIAGSPRSRRILSAIEQKNLQVQGGIGGTQSGAWSCNRYRQAA